MVTAACTVPAKRFAQKVGYVAHPSDRTVHKKPIPYGGGAAMFLGFLVAVLVAAALPPFRHSHMFSDSPEMLGVVLAAGAMFAVGLIDDVRDMSAPAKMAGQVLAASILYFAGVTMYQLKIPLAGFFVLTPGIVPLITAVWVIALTNAVNLIDGLDGLAAGVVAIAGGTLAVYGLRLTGFGLLPSDNIGPLVATIACGICLGFLPFNFNPARIFMGDAGALLLGLLMAASTMVISGRVPPDVPISASPTSSSPRCSSRCSSSVSRWSTWPSPSSGARRGARASTHRTRSTSITACSIWVTAPGAASSSCGPGRPCSQASSFSPLRAPGQRVHPARGGRPGRRALHVLSSRAAAGERRRRRGAPRPGNSCRPWTCLSGKTRLSGSLRDRLDAIWAGMR